VFILDYFVSCAPPSRRTSDALTAKLELTEKDREKAEADAAAVEDLRQRLNKAENALSDKFVQQIAREEAIINRFDTQNHRFIGKFSLYLSLCLS
jgi:hypothetical protein